jgi:flagellar biosynthetic protein FlhB
MPSEDKTEQATPQHKQDMRKKGQVAKSQEVASALTLLAGYYAMKNGFPMMKEALNDFVATTLQNIGSFHATTADVHALYMRSGLTFCKITVPILGAVGAAAMVGNVAQAGLMFTSAPIVPDFKRLNPLQGIAQMFSKQGAMELGKSMLKVAIMSYMVYAFLLGQRSSLVTLGIMDVGDVSKTVREILVSLTLRICSIILVFAGLDYALQRAQHEKRIKMTKEEVKEEMKRSEGDPMVKAQFRSRHRQLAMQRMMKDVPKADVVITNPTHYAVALKYDSATMMAPVVLAKGKQLVAKRIRQIARENRVPVVENPPVARALYASAKIGDAVPVELYRAVAEILAFVYRVHRRARA